MTKHLKIQRHRISLRTCQIKRDTGQTRVNYSRFCKYIICLRTKNTLRGDYESDVSSSPIDQSAPCVTHISQWHCLERPLRIIYLVIHYFYRSQTRNGEIFLLLLIHWLWSRSLLSRPSHMRWRDVCRQRKKRWRRHYHYWRTGLVGLAQCFSMHFDRVQGFHSFPMMLTPLILIRPLAVHPG